MNEEKKPKLHSSRTGTLPNSEAEMAAKYKGFTVIHHNVHVHLSAICLVTDCIKQVHKFSDLIWYTSDKKATFAKLKAAKTISLTNLLNLKKK